MDVISTKNSRMKFSLLHIIKVSAVRAKIRHHIHDKITSPLSKAIHSEDLDLINLACDIYLETLTLDQIRHAKNELLPLIEVSATSNLETIYDILMKIETKLKKSA